jgi:hypothetical protein
MTSTRPVLQQARPLPVCDTLSLKNKPKRANKYETSAFSLQIRDICVHAALAALNVVSSRVSAPSAASVFKSAFI